MSVTGVPHLGVASVYPLGMGVIPCKEGFFVQFYCFGRNGSLDYIQPRLLVKADELGAVAQHHRVEHLAVAQLQSDLLTLDGVKLMLVAKSLPNYILKLKPANIVSGLKLNTALISPAIQKPHLSQTPTVLPAHSVRRVPS